MRRVALLACVLAAATAAALVRAERTRSDEAAQPGHRLLAGLQRRLHRPPLQPARRDQRRQRQGAQPRLGLPPESGRPNANVGSIKGTPLQINGVMYLTAPDHVWALDARTGPRDLAPCLAIERRHPHRQSRRRRSSATRLYLRDAGLQPRLAEHQGRHRALAQADLRSRSVLLRVGRADDRQESRHRRRQRRRPRRPRLRPGARSGDRRDAVALVRRAAEEGRSRVGDLAERRSDEARRRHDVAAGHLRSGAEPDLRHDRQSAAGHRARQPRRRQPVHRVDRGAQSRHRQDGVVLPVVAARYARLGCDADAGAVRRRDQRPAAQAPRAGGAQRPLLRPRSHRPARRSSRRIT